MTHYCLICRRIVPAAEVTTDAQGRAHHTRRTPAICIWQHGSVIGRWIYPARVQAHRVVRREEVARG